MNKWNPDDFQKDNIDETNDAIENEAKSDSHDESAEHDTTSKFEWIFGKNKDSKAKEAEQSYTSEAEKAGTATRPVQQEKRFKKNSLNLLIILALVIFLLINSVFVVSEGQWFIVTRFGKIVKAVDEPGLKFRIPFVDNFHTLSSKIMEYNVSRSEVLTADKKAMIVDSYVLWRLEDPIRYVRTVSGNVNEMQKRIDASVYSNIKNIVGRKQQNEIITDEESSRDTLNQQITQFSAEELKNYGIEVLRVEIKRYDLPSDNLSAVYNRMISEREQMAASFKAEGEYEAAKMRNETDKTYEITIGEAEAEAERLKGEAEERYIASLSEIYSDKDLADFYNFAMEMDTLEAGLQGDKTVIVGPNSVFGKMFGGVPENK